jgi:anti-sigma factor RsiW
MNPRDYNEWLDGLAQPSRAAQVERQLGPDAAEERLRWERTGDLLREHLQCPPPQHPDFINARVAAAIRAGVAQQRPPRLHRLIFAGFGALGAAALLTVTLLPQALRPPARSEFLSHVVSARAGDPQVSVSSFHPPHERSVVLWLEGAPYIQPGEQIR